MKLTYEDSVMDIILYKYLRDKGWSENRIKKVVVAQIIICVSLIIIGVLVIIT